MKYEKGHKIWIGGEKKPYTIRACDDRWLICTKPYNFRKETVMYFIADLKENIRGTDNYSIGPYGYYSDEDCNDALKDLQTSEGSLCGFGISYRNRVQLDIVKYK